MSINIRHYSLTNLRRMLSSVLILLVALVFTCQASVSAMTPAERRAYMNKGIVFIDDPCAEAVLSGPVAVSASEAGIAKIIIGIAKTLGLDKKGALIGLMVANTESHFQIYANTGVPISQKNPVWLAIPPAERALGHDHDSVGVFQQRVSTGWSTFGNGTGKDVVWQLMDPAYSAQAFFGTPSGAQLPSGLKQPSAIQKGLLNQSGWQSLDPWVAAQRVQVSAYDGNPRAANNFSSVYGGNYKDSMPHAQSLLDQFWDSSPAVALPIPTTGGAAAPAGAAAAAGADGCTGAVSAGGILGLILGYAWPQYHPADYGLTQDQVMPDYWAAVNAAQSSGGYVGGGAYPGIDCGGFVTLVMRNSGLDPEYNKNNGPVTDQKVYLETSGKYTKMTGIKSPDTLVPGDIYINPGASHTYMFVGHLTYTDEKGVEQTFGGTSASASFGDNYPTPSWRSPMADDTYFEPGSAWYRLK